jgi:hypothetical protein
MHAILPNLKSIDFTTIESVAYPYVQTFLGPNIKNVHFLESDPGDQAVLISSLSRLSPNIQYLQLKIEILESSVLDFLRRLHHLRVLSLRGVTLNKQLASHLGSFPHLTGRAAHRHRTRRLYGRNCTGPDTVPLVTKYSCHTAVTIRFPCYI